MESLAATSPAGVLLDLAAVLILLCGFACLGSKLFSRYVTYYGAQSIVLSFATGVVAYQFGRPELWVLALLTLAIKGIGIPTIARRMLIVRLELKRDVAVSTGLSTSLILGGILTAFAYLVTRPANLPTGLVAAAVVPISTAVILLGGLTMVVRRHTVAQLIGWLILENGVFLGAITLVATFPFIVEAGVFLDLVAAVLIMLVFVSGLTRQLAEASATELRGLRGVMAMLTTIALIAGFPLAGTLAAAGGARARGAGYAAIAGAIGTLALVVSMMVHVLSRGPVSAASGFVYVDALGTFFLLTVALVVLVASLGSAAYLRAEEQAGALSALQVRLYFVFFGLFATLMLASLETGNLGLLFVLIEGSTLASVLLVGLEAKARSLEAAWKYVIISSLGVTIALVGTLFLFYSGSGLQLTSNLRLAWPFLYAHAGQLSHPNLRLAFLLAVVGYGTKVGLAPMHTWLPDAHAEAPSPASAMLSAALLNTGMYAIIRFLAIAQVGLGTAYVRHVMLAFGFLSIIIGVLFMVRRGNFKRLFAYSSVEHMGIIAVALGFGGTLGLYGALLHTLNHAIGKSVLFLSSGDVVLAYHSRETRDVRGLLGALPLTGGVLLLATLAILGSPPFGLFLSELTIVRAGFTLSHPVLPVLLLLLLVVAFIGLARSVTGMVTGPSPGRLQAYPTSSQRVLAALPLVVGLAGLLLLGVWVPGGLHHAIMGSIGAIS